MQLFVFVYISLNQSSVALETPRGSGRSIISLAGLYVHQSSMRAFHNIDLSPELLKQGEFQSSHRHGVQEQA